jgi:lipopolysaccharide cholinephosphotransferase
MPLSTFEQLKTLRSDSMVVPDDTQLARLHAILLDMLKEVAEFCEASHVCYLLSGGSVLGSVRHGGFIPWDDDVDLFMPRKDYELFRKTFVSSFDGKYWLDSPEATPEIGIPIARIRLEGTKARLYNDPESPHCGVGIDIFVLENVPDNALVRYFHGIRCLLVGLLFSCRRFSRDKEFYLSLGGSSSYLRTVKVKSAIGALVSFWSVEQWCKHLVRVYSNCKNDESTYISCPSGRLHYFGELYRREEFLPPSKGQFEDIILNLPRIPEYYLKKLYGNWQQVPPEESRERHGYLELDFGKYA